MKKWIWTVIALTIVIAATLVAINLLSGQRLRPTAEAISTPAASSSPSAASTEDSVDRVEPEIDFDAARKVLTQKCTQKSSDVERADLDINNDNVPDEICWLRSKSEENDYFNLLASVRSKGKIQTSYVLLPFDGGRQIALCPTDQVVVTLDKWSREKAMDVLGEYPGPVSLTISDGNCDPAWLFWPQNTTEEDVKFAFYRM